MKKIFALYSTIKFTAKPVWLESFLEKYYGSYDVHVTLKQSCFIDKKEFVKVQKKLTDYFSRLHVKNHQIKLVFNMLVEEGGVIMINAEDNSEINVLQKELVELLGEYDDFIEPELESYQNNFKPHITIAMDLKERQMKEALKELDKRIVCKGVIKDVTLSLVSEITSEEANNPNNKTIYKL